MMSIASKPSVFVGSTITDFCDLRDALKYWLEEMGFDVQMSECTDFSRRPGAGAFEACFEAIRTSDYYLLLVGARRGSWFDQRNGLSVTRKEYRVARESLAKKGSPKILPFVRRDVVVALSEREKSEVPKGARSTLEDPDSTGDFLREIRREEQVQKVVREGGDCPSHNWLAEFRSFRELTDVLRSTLRLREPLARMALIETLRHEMEQNLQIMMMNRKGHPFFRHWWLDSVRRAVSLSMEAVNGDIWLEFEDLQHLLVYVETGPPPPDNFVRTALNEAIVSSALLVFDTQAHRFIPSPLLESVRDLRNELDIYEKRYRIVEELHGTVFKIWGDAQPYKSGSHLPGHAIAMIYALHDSHLNVTRLLIAILRFLYGHTETIEFELRPVSPILDQCERIEAERVSSEQLRGWLKQDHRRLAGETRETDETQREKTREAMNRLEAIVGKEKLMEMLDKIINEPRG